MRRSLTRVRNLVKGREQPKNDLGSKVSPVHVGNDAHYADCHIDTLKVGIAEEVAYPKKLSQRRVNVSERSMYHSNRLDELKNSSSRRKSI